MANEAKKEAVAKLAEKLKKAQSFIMVDYKGITGNDETKLRKDMRESGAEYLVAKNRLFKLALKEAGIDANFDDLLEGTTAFAFGYDDVVAPAKTAFDFSTSKAKEKIFTIKGGYLSGKRVDAAEVEALAKLPSRDQLLSMLLNSMLGPVRKLAYGLVAISDKKAEAPEA